MNKSSWSGVPIIVSPRQREFYQTLTLLCKKSDFVSSLLIEKKIDYEFMKVLQDFSVIENYISSNVEIKTSEIKKIIGEEVVGFNIMKSKIISEYSFDRVIEYVDSKQRIVEHLAEKISLMKLNHILRSTTIIENNYNFESISIEQDYTDIDNQVENIQYEIDRLNGEMLLENIV